MSSAIQAITRNLRTLTDGTVRLQIDIEPNDAVVAMTLFGCPSTPVALAQLSQEFAIEDQRAKTIASEQGLLAKALHRSSFLRRAEVAQVLGSDDLFQKWVRQKPCVVSGAETEIEFSHVRRLNRGAGMGIKPRFSGVPMHRDIHRNQHQHGEHEMLKKYLGQASLRQEDAKQRLEDKSSRYLMEWCKERLKKKFNVKSTTELDYKKLCLWSEDNGIFNLLPDEIKQFA